MKYICPCCGYRTLEEPGDSYDICPVCFWESNDLQNNDENIAGDANTVCLREARENFKKYGVSELRYINEVRPPHEDELT